jgi:hypothetical protein
MLRLRNSGGAIMKQPPPLPVTHLQRQQRQQVRSCYSYFLGLSLLVMTSYICSVITTTQMMQEEKGHPRLAGPVRDKRRQHQQPQQPQQQQRPASDTIEESDDWPSKAFFRQVHYSTDSRRMVVAMVNYDYIDFADNFAQSLLQQNVSNFCLVPMDDPTYGTNSKYTVALVSIPSWV